ncbi:MAG: glycoside hydrolase family 5 protein [Kiritimatiellae bacterium]|nr:glycoside hydrolase family 5 protein [Kiritimatiellia bacterium]
MSALRLRTLAIVLGLVAAAARAPAAALERVAVSPDGAGFVLRPSGRPFRPWGFNYDHDRDGRLLEEYWATEWTNVVGDFHEMRTLGANVVRIHLQFGAFIEAPDRPNAAALDRLQQLVEVARQCGLRLILTGLGGYRRRAVPRWYDELDETGRWRAQAAFWRAVARRCRGRPEVFAYDLMNEPVIGGGTNRADWYTGELAGLVYVQRIALDTAGRPREAIATDWVRALATPIREEDPEALITVGEIPWAMVWPGARSVFHTPAVSNLLDFVSIHVYPRGGELERASGAVRANAVGKPVVVEEIFPLECGIEELERWMRSVRDQVAGWVGFYWGATPEELRAAPASISNALLLGWLELFRRAAPEFARPWPPD